MSKRLFFGLIAILILTSLVIAGRLGFSNFIKRAFPGPPPWSEENIFWKKEVDGSYKDINVKVSLEIDKSLGKRKDYPILAFEEDEGKFQDLANAVAAGISFLPNSRDGGKTVDINMDLYRKPDRNGNWWAPVDFYPRRDLPNQSRDFSTDTPIRLIFEDGNREKLYPDGVQKGNVGWGVDRKNGQLIVRFSLSSSDIEFAQKNSYSVDPIVTKFLYAIDKIIYIEGDYTNKERKEIILSFWEPKKKEDTIILKRIIKFITK